jgi:GT2 family glycosyltransferase
MGTVDVSIIVVNYNGREWVGPCLASIPASTGRRWQAICVDNGSKDGSAEYVASAFPNTILIRNSGNRGFAAAANQGIERAIGRDVLLLNPDARLSPGSLDRLLEVLESRADCGIVAPQLVHEDGGKQHSIDDDPTLATALVNKSLLRRLRHRSEPVGPTEVENGVGAALLIRGAVLREVGRFDEDYFLFLEETDLCLRARRAGWKVLFAPDARVVHLQGRAKAPVWVRAHVEYVRSLFTFFRKHRPAAYPLLRILDPAKSLVEVVSLGILNVLTVFLAARKRRRWLAACALLAWQMLLCPRGFGLASHG